MQDAPTTFAFEDFVLDLAKSELRQAGTPVPVEPQVFDLIAYLCRNSARVISRDELIAHVWQGRIVSDAAISTRINAARKALGDDGKTQRLIRTITRKGFRFLMPSAPAQGPGPAPSTRAHVRYCRAPDGTNLAYEAIGEGPPLLKAPSFLTHLEFEHHSPVWRHWIRELSRHNTLIRFDQRGNGLSDRDVADLSFDAHVSDLLAVADHLGLERFPIIGLSQGAPIAVEFAYRHPDRVTGLILLGGYPAGWRKLGDPDLRQRRDALLDLIPVGWGSGNPVFRQTYTSLFVPGGTPEQHDWFNEMQRMSANPENAARLLGAFSEIDVRPRLPEINAPALVLHCRNDQLVPVEAGRQYAIHLPNAHFVLLDGDNHVLLEHDAAWPVFLAELRRFLSELPAD